MDIFHSLKIILMLEGFYEMKYIYNNINNNINSNNNNNGDIGTSNIKYNKNNNNILNHESILKIII